MFSTKKSIPYILIFILLVFILKGIFFIFLIPPWEAPDEPGHVAYVEYLYKYKRLPSALKPLISLSINRSFEENGKILKNIRTKQLNTIEKRNLWDRSDRRLDPVPVNLASHPPLYYVYLLPFYILSLPFSSYGTVILLRFASLILGLGSLLVIFSLGKKLFKKNINLSYLLVFLVSFQPMFSFTHAVVNSDAFVIFVFLYWVNRALEMIKKKKILDKDLFILTFISALSALVKPQLIILVVMFVLLMRLANISKRKILIYCLVSSIPSLIWIFYKYTTEGTGFLSYAIQQAGDISRPVWMYPLEFILQKQPVGIFMSFWGFFGWLDVPMPKWTYLLFFVIIVVGAGGSFTRVKKIRLKTVPKEIILLFSACFLYILSIFVFDIQVFAFAHHFVIHGRYFVPVLPFILIVILKGVNSYSQSLRKILFILVVTIFFMSQLIMYATLSSYYYGSAYINPFKLMSMYR